MSITSTGQRPQQRGATGTVQDLITKLIGEVRDPVIAELLKSMPPLELLKVLPFKGKGVSGRSVEEVSGLSRDSVERHYPDWIIDLSPRRRGMRTIHALLVGAVKKPLRSSVSETSSIAAPVL
jgi:hypothetical protein